MKLIDGIWLNQGTDLEAQDCSEPGTVMFKLTGDMRSREAFSDQWSVHWSGAPGGFAVFHSSDVSTFCRTAALPQGVQSPATTTCGCVYDRRDGKTVQGIGLFKSATCTHKGKTPLVRVVDGFRRYFCGTHARMALAGFVDRDGAVMDPNSRSDFQRGLVRMSESMIEWTQEENLMQLTISSDAVTPEKGMTVITNSNHSTPGLRMVIGAIVSDGVYQCTLENGGSYQVHPGSVDVDLSCDTSLWRAALRLWGTSRGADDAKRAGTTAAVREQAIRQALHRTHDASDVEVIRKCLEHHYL